MLPFRCYLILGVLHVWPSITVDGVTRLKEYTELTPAEAIQADCDIKVFNALVSQHHVAKDLWEKIKLLMQGTSLTKQERECKLYDEFDKFTYKKGESLHEYYLRFTLLLNDMNIYKMPLEQFQVNTKFLNTLPDEWSKFVTDVKLVKDLHTTNVDQLHAYLEQHERHANKVRLMSSHQITQSPYQTHQHTYQNTQLQPPASTYPSPQYVFQKGDDPINAINYMMSFFTAVVTSRYPTTNNQLRNSSNPRQQAPINNGRVTLQPIQGGQTSFVAGTLRTYTPRASGSNSGKQRTVICYNCKKEGHMSRQCTKPKRKRDDTWFKEKCCCLFGCIGLLIVTTHSAKVALMANLSHYGSDALDEIEESRNIDREIALEKQIKHLDNIVFKRDQSAQTVHMLTKPQFFYNSTTKQALEKEKERTNTSIRTHSVEVPKELPKVSMVNTSLKKLKYHFANFDVVIKSVTANNSVPVIWGFHSFPLFYLIYDECRLRARRNPTKPNLRSTSRKTLSVTHGSCVDHMRVAESMERSNFLVLSVDLLRIFWGKCCAIKDEAAAFIIIFEDDPILADSTDLPLSTTVDKDAPSPSNSQTTPETEPPIIQNDVEEDNHDIKVAHMGNEPYFGVPILEIPSDQPSSSDFIHTIQALFCYYDAFLTVVEPKTYKDALTQACSIEAMQEELNEFERLEEHVENGVIELYFVNTEYQLADIFTKALGRNRIEFLINKLGMRSFTPETLKQLADEVDE
ncbi:retrovirus-related pol polyprotein from transposon TNT 1-94 [Tanacetum coccineum]